MKCIQDKNNWRNTREWKMKRNIIQGFGWFWSLNLVQSPVIEFSFAKMYDLWLNTFRHYGRWCAQGSFWQLGHVTKTTASIRLLPVLTFASAIFASGIINHFRGEIFLFFVYEPVFLRKKRCTLFVLKQIDWLTWLTFNGHRRDLILIWYSFWIFFP